MEELDTLSSDLIAANEGLSLSDFVKDQLNNIKINMEKVWKFYNAPVAKHNFAMISTSFDKCAMCTECQPSLDKHCDRVFNVHENRV